MAQRGTVQKVKGKHVFVKVLREEACAHCNVCTTGLNEGKECVIEAVNKCDAKIGDIVDIDIQTNYFLRATAIMYGIPLLVLIVGLFVGGAITKILEVANQELITAIIGLALTGMAYLFINKQEKNKKTLEYLPVAISKATNTKN